jgi:hypothetical protein
MTSVAVRLSAHNDASIVSIGSPGASPAADEIMMARQVPRAEAEFAAIAELMMQPENAPTETAVDLASTWLPLIVTRVAKLSGWQTPHITSSEQGEIVCEWWRKAKKLTIYFGDDGAEFIKVWGADIEQEMESGDLASEWDIVAVWRWLQS